VNVVDYWGDLEMEMDGKVKLDMLAGVVIIRPEMIDLVSPPPEPPPVWVGALLRAFQVFGFALMVTSFASILR
jgi:hypothetical protein